MRVTAADMVVRALEDEHVRFTFGIPGTHNIELYDALDRSSITPVLVTDEQSASFMADAVSRTTGGVGVVNLVPGAGVTHALSGIAEAFLDTVPMVVLTCGIRSDTGRGYQLHDIDQAALLRPITKAVLSAAAISDVYPLLRRAFALARSGAPGPVAVEVPANLYLTRDDAEPVVPEPVTAREPSPEAVAEACRLLQRARAPLLYVGWGARGAAAALPRLAESLAAPVATTIQGKGVFPEDHPLFVWNGLGRSAPPFVRTATEHCDVMLAIGCRFSEVGTASYGFEPPGCLVHVDADSRVLNRNFPAAVAIEADAARFVEALLAVLAPRTRDARLEHGIADGRRALEQRWTTGESRRVRPHALLSTLQELAGPEGIFTSDSGNGTFLAMEHLRLTRPGRFLAPVDFSCMGYAVPAAIGACLANPGAKVVALAGDGALLMTGLELLTAATYEAAPVVCVLRDGELAQIAQFQRTTLNRATCSRLHDYSVEALAAATRCAFVPMPDEASCRPALEQAFACARDGRPAVVEVAVDYSEKTFFTRGVVTTNLWRLAWPDRLRLLGRAVARRLGGR